VPDPYSYRNKNQIVYQNSPREKIVCGFYQEGSHRVIGFKRCLVQDGLSDRIAQTIREIMINLHLPAYNEDYHQGFLRHVLIKRSFITNQTMVVLVTGRDTFPKLKEFMEVLLKRHPEITTVVQNINSSKTSYVLGDREKILYGTGNIIDVLCGKKFIVSARSFYQVNPYQAEVLYDTALEMAKLNKNEVLMDAYSGVGTIGIVASDFVKRVISVEIVEDAV
jgi:23S rRNA (uracil1939-C5)-methyltransferase